MGKLESIKKIRFVLTDYCNYQCKFCHNEGTSTINTKFLDRKNISTLTHVAKSLGIEKITLTGGEPLLHPEIVNVVNDIKTIYPTVILSMATNGMLFNREKLTIIIPNINQLRLNFQSLDENVSRNICGKNVKVGKIFGIIDDARKLNPSINICLNFVLTKLNKESLPDVIKYAIDNNLDVKLLEYMAINKDFYVDTEYAEQVLGLLNPASVFKDYQDDNIYTFTNSLSRIRLCYSFCNGLRCKSCRECGEVRLTPRSELKHCFDRTIQDIDIEKELAEHDMKSIEDILVLIDKMKGKLFGATI